MLNSTLKKTQEDIIPASMQHNFIHVNRAELVNMAHIDSIKDHTLVAKQYAFEASDAYLKDVKKALSIG